MEDDVSIIQEDLNTWTTKNPTRKIPKLSAEKSRGQRFLSVAVFAGYLYTETECFVFAFLYRESKTRNYDRHCLAMNVVSRCRKYYKMSETTEQLGAHKYLNRHISRDATNWQKQFTTRLP